MSIDVELSRLKLDRENPRFQTSFGAVDEKEIYQYIKEYEMLDNIIDSIKRSGFFQIGERIVVVEDGGNYRVLEGNRRVCALKTIHGYYGQEPLENESLINATKIINVDLITNLDDIQPFLAVRHIQGVKKWSAESRRLFYFKHFENGKNLNQIREMSQQPLSEIKKFIRQQYFLNYFKSIANVQHIESPSLIYERIYSYSVDLKIIQEIELNDETTISDLRIATNPTILSSTEIRVFYENIHSSIFNENKDYRIINSRTINKIDDFKRFLRSDEVRSLFPELHDLIGKVIERNNRLDFKPIARINTAIQGTVPEISKIIDYNLIMDHAVVSIEFEGNVIDESAFRAGQPGIYNIHINEHIFPFKIEQYVKPKILATSLLTFTLGGEIDLSNAIKVYNHKNEVISLDDSIVEIEVPNDLSINGSILRASTAGDYVVKILVKINEPDKTYMASHIIDIKVRPHTETGHNVHINDKYFMFRIIDLSKANSYLNNSVLLDEIELAYKNNHLYIFITALRSLLDLYLIEFLYRSKRQTNGNKFALFSNESQLRNEFTKSGFLDFDKISVKYHNIMSSKHNYQLNRLAIKNYFQAQITPDHITQVIATLHLGAHNSLRNLSPSNITSIKPYLTAWIEMLFVLETIDFVW